MAQPGGRAIGACSDAVRRILAESGNAPMKLTAVFETLKARYPELPVASKTQFRRDVVGPMFDRGLMVKTRVDETVKGKTKKVWVMRLAATGYNRKAVSATGVAWAAGHPAPAPLGAAVEVAVGAPAPSVPLA